MQRPADRQHLSDVPETTKTGKAALTQRHNFSTFWSGAAEAWFTPTTQTCRKVRFAVHFDNSRKDWSNQFGSKVIRFFRIIFFWKTAL